MKLLWITCVSVAIAWSATAQEIAPDSAKQAVKLQEIRVQGSRLPAKSILRLTGLQAGQTIDEARLRTALKRANDSGLFKNITYDYESAPDSTDVILELKVDDQLPLTPATIKIPNVDAEQVWLYLQNFDPLFTRELPYTDSAIKLYARYITKYLETLGRTDIAVIGKILGTEHVTGVEFAPVKLRSAGR
jgi:surface antigen-like variable number repeat protein